MFKNKDNEIIYIGKAVRLKDRVSSYGNHTSLDAAKKAMVREINDIKIYPCDSEIEALILEAQLIKKYSPRFNVLLKDDKSYAYLAWTKEPFPRLFVTYQSYIDKHDKELCYLGPFVNADSLRASLRILRKIFPYRSCKSLPSTPCIYYKLNLCNAPCIQNIEVDKYRRNLDNIIQFMKGNKKNVIRSLIKLMNNLSANQEFEKAAQVRNQIQALENVMLHSGIIKTQNARNQNHMKDLQKELSLDKLPKRIEGFDSSHFHGDKAVVSMVVFENGLPNKTFYRRFRIQNPPNGGDDFYNLHQALTRRFHRSDWPIPDLIIIDGGKGQLKQALDAQNNGLIQFKSIPIISLAKQEEEIFIPDKKESIRLNKTSKALHLVQSVRDESHRFAITYHRTLRDVLPESKK
jgi:excinuclease ABC subunit C